MTVTIIPVSLVSLKPFHDTMAGTNTTYQDHPLMVSIILLFHGSRYPTAIPEADRLCQHLQRSVPSARLTVAWLQHSSPTLPEALASAKAAGAEMIRVLPLFALTGRHVEFDVPRLVEDFKEQNPDLTVVLEPHLGTDPGFALWLTARIEMLAATSSISKTKE